MKSCKNLKGGLSDLAEDLSVQRSDCRDVRILISEFGRSLASDRSTKQVVTACLRVRRFSRCETCTLNARYTAILSVCCNTPLSGAQIDDEKWMGVLFGLGGHASITGAASYQVPPSSGSVEPANGKP